MQQINKESAGPVLINFAGLISIQNLPELFGFHIVDVDSQLSKPHHVVKQKQFMKAGPEPWQAPKKEMRVDFTKNSILKKNNFDKWPRCNVCTLMLDTCTLKSSNLAVLWTSQLKSTPKQPN